MTHEFLLNIQRSVSQTFWPCGENKSVEIGGLRAVRSR